MVAWPPDLCSVHLADLLWTTIFQKSSWFKLTVDSHQIPISQDPLNSEIDPHASLQAPSRARNGPRGGLRWPAVGEATRSVASSPSCAPPRGFLSGKTFPLNLGAGSRLTRACRLKPAACPPVVRVYKGQKGPGRLVAPRTRPPYPRLSGSSWPCCRPAASWASFPLLSPEISAAFCAVVERGGWEKTCLQGFSQLDSGGPNPGESPYKQGNQQL